MKTSKLLSIQAICHLSVLVALEVILNRFCTIQTPFLKIGVSFVAVVLGGLLYGPVGGAIVGGLGDMIGALLFPFGPYHPGFSFCGALMGAVYGFFLDLHSKHFPNSVHIPLWPNIVVPMVFNCAVVGLLINTLWISQLYDSKSYWGYFISRIPQEAGLSVVKTVVTPALIPIARQVQKLIVRPIR